MSENGNTWPPPRGSRGQPQFPDPRVGQRGPAAPGWLDPRDPRDPREPTNRRNPRDPMDPMDPRDPQGTLRPQRTGSHRRPQGQEWPPQSPRSLPPPGYEPVHHEPRHGDPLVPDEPRTEDSPWRRTQREPRPETAGWHPGGPAQASYEGPAGGYPPGQDPSGQDLGHQDPGHQDAGDRYEDEAGGMFVPGFGSYEDEDEDTYPAGAAAGAARPGPGRPPGAGAGGSPAGHGGAGSAGSRPWPPCWSSSSRSPSAVPTATAST